MMSDNQRLDDALAEMTDSIIENRTMETTEEMNDLSDVVRGLYALIEPNEQPSQLFETRMKQRLDQEWEQRTRRAAKPRLHPITRTMGIAAALVMALVVMILVNRGIPDNAGLPGTAFGSADTLIVLVTVAAVAGVGLLVWRNRR